VPKRIAVAVNKANLTHDMIAATGVFNVSVLTEEAPFKVFQHFGFQSGRDTDKFAGCADVRTANGVRSVPKNTNAVLSGKVLSAQDCGTHTLFFADVTEAHVLSEIPSATYEYYFSNIKPKPQPPEKGKKGWVCKICGYVYEGEVLPPDFICPLCKHGAADFEPLK
ncbi:MAG: flavin reductase, partial [Ruthenibacterium sp.]